MWLFFKENYGFHYSLIFFSFKYLSELFFWRSIMMSQIYLIFLKLPWPCKNTFRLNISSIRFVSLKHLFCYLFVIKRSLSSYFYNSVILILKGKVKNYTWNEKPEDEQPSSLFRTSIPTPYCVRTITGHLPHQKNLWLNSRFFFPNLKI